jgi:mRNA (guanine-N7-)-methyltransferase
MFLDIAETSVEQCETRYKEMVDRNSRDRYPQPMFSSEFIAADCG